MSLERNLMTQDHMIYLANYLSTDDQAGLPLVYAAMISYLPRYWLYTYWSIESV